MNKLLILIFTIISSQAIGQAFSFSNDFTNLPTIQTDTIDCIGAVVTDAGNFGGEIDYVVTNTNGSSNLAIFNNSFFVGYQVEGSIEYIWDGIDGNAKNLALNTSIADLGSCGDISVAFSETNFPTPNLYFDLTIEMYNASGRYISWTSPVVLGTSPVTVTANTSQFQTFGTGDFDFNDLRALRIILNLSSANNNNLSADILSVSWVPDVSENPDCAPMPAIFIPTLGQWTVISLGLLLMILGVVAVTKSNPVKI